jgi:general nucleoside transport system permease protein
MEDLHATRMAASAEGAALRDAVRGSRQDGGLPIDALESLLLSLIAIVAAALLFGAFLAVQGHDALAVYRTLYLGAFGTRFSLESTLTQAAPLLLTALCTLIPARVGLLVIGAEGAVVLGGLGAAVAGVALSGAPAGIGTVLTIAAGALAGGLWIGAAGALKHFRGVNETISTLLLNYIAIALLNHLVSGPIRDFSQTLKAQSWSIPKSFMIGNIPGYSVHWGLLIGLVVCVALHLVLRHTTLGFAMDILAGNRRAAQMTGLPIGRLILLACFLGGAAAGLAGAIEIVAVHGAASESLVVGIGYAGILVAFLARQNPLAVVLVALVLGGISASGGLLQRRFDIPHAATTVLQGLIFLTVLASGTFRGRLLPRRDAP